MKDPSKEEFIEAVQTDVSRDGFEYDQSCIDYVIKTHYEEANRPFRCCQPRDLLLQVRNFCTYKKVERVLSNQAFDFAVENYFSVM